MNIAVGDSVRVTVSNHREVKANAVGVVRQLGVKYPGDVRVKFPHDPDLLWVYLGEYEKEEATN